QVSDIHLGPTIGRRFMDDMVARVNALRPDLVAITGDLVDGSISELGPSVAALQNLRSRFGSAFITGNHEYYSGDEEWCDALSGLGVQVLRNRRLSIGDAGGSFDLLGVDDWSGKDEHRYDLERALAGRDPERAAVLLAHQPKGFEQAAGRGVGLQLSGHTHGGQMFPFNFMVALTTPFTAGLYRHQGGQLYVSRGTGYWGPPFRVGSPPEIVKVVLQPA
ncbi:MAG TPA: metallophosphoesterase, partial [Gemmatimonadales bacterium]|nr:metallophosphoesterase [Gemmatimonadales bacterium]